MTESDGSWSARLQREEESGWHGGSSQGGGLRVRELGCPDGARRGEDRPIMIIASASEPANRVHGLLEALCSPTPSRYFSSGLAPFHALE